MYNSNFMQDSDDLIILKEKDNLENSYKELSYKYLRIKKVISDLHFELSRKEILLHDDTLDISDKAVIKYDSIQLREDLEQAIYKKEILFKDITIISNRLKLIDNEIRRNTPWWKRIFIPVRQIRFEV